jgi:hypothetical protein
MSDHVRVKDASRGGTKQFCKKCGVTWPCAAKQAEILEKIKAEAKTP